MGLEQPNVPKKKIQTNPEDLISAAREKLTQETSPEKTEQEAMAETQEKVQKELDELQSEGLLSKIPDSIKKPLLMALTGATIFFSMGNFEKAQAGGYHRNDNYSDFLKGAVEDVIRNIPYDIQRQQREDEQQRREEREDQRRRVWEHENERRNERRQHEYKIEGKERQFDQERQRALREYQSDVDRARSNEAIKHARYIYNLKLDAINEAEMQEGERGRY